MRLLSILLARTFWFCPIQDLNPRGLNIIPILQLIQGLYKFRKIPVERGDFDLTQGIKFEDGEFKTKDGNLIGVNFVIFSEVLLADTRSSTSDSDAFLVDLLTQLSTNFGLPSYERIIRKRNYLSNVHVSMNKNLKLINPKLQEISDYLTVNVVGHGNVPFEVGGVAFWPDQIEPLKPSPFSLERVFGTPFSENRYFSAAPLETEPHLELLNKLESLL